MLIMTKYEEKPTLYYYTDPDEASYFVCISDLNEEQKEYINTVIDLDVDVDEEGDSIENVPTKYHVDAPLYNKRNETYPFDDLLEYLNKQGFIMIML